MNIIIQPDENGLRGRHRVRMYGIALGILLILSGVGCTNSSTPPPPSPGTAKSPYDARGHLKPLEGNSAGKRPPFPNGHP